LCREEASELASLLPELNQRGVPLVGIVHEELGVEEFRPYLKGDLFLDKERVFYGPQERRMFLSGFLRWGVWQSLFRARGKGVAGNLEGEGRILGGLFVMGANDQGVILEYREKEFGDHADLKDVMSAVDKIKVN